MKNYTFLIYCLLFMICSKGYSLETKLILDDGKTVQGWDLHEGREFPGAKGSICQGKLDNQQGILLNYDFSKGGVYIRAGKNYPLPPKVTTVKLDITASQPAKVSLFLIDQNGKQQREAHQVVKQGDNVLSFVVNDDKHHVVGKEKAINPPYKGFQIFISPINEYKNNPGKVLIKTVSAVSTASKEQLADNFKGENFSLSTNGWHISGSWGGNWNSPRIGFDVQGNGQPTDIEISFPGNHRDLAFRTKLIPGTNNNFYYTVPLKNFGNVYNIYQIKLSVKGQSEQSIKTIQLAGKHSSLVNFGKPKPSSEIKNLAVGTCAHFALGKDKYGAFKGWHDWKTLIDMINQAGFKWIRDGVRVEKDASGNHTIREWDLDWIKYAHSKGIRVIAEIDLNAKDSVEEVINKCLVIVRDTQKYNPVYELGNEPYNMGGWRPKYGGPWNAKGKNNETSPWAQEHLKYQNAIADALKAKYPDITIIGFTGLAPVNYRYMDLGVSDNIDGIAEHPYSYSSVPERIPFNRGNEKRDGVKLGDREGSFRGFIKDYGRKFKEIGKKRSIWVTEFGYTTFSFSGKNEKGLYAGYTESAQANYILRRFIESLTLPIAATCQYDFIDDYGSNVFGSEANFGLVRIDKSPKPSYYVMQRFCSLFGDSRYIGNEEVIVESQPRHGATGKHVVKWEGRNISTANDIRAYPFENENLSGVRMLAVWSAQPYTQQFNNRITTIRLKNWAKYKAKPVAIDLITGRSFDLDAKIDGNDLKLDKISIKQHPILIYFIDPGAK